MVRAVVENLVGAKCLNCDPHGRGVVVSRQGAKPFEREATYFGRLYPLSKWEKHPKCPNCKSALVALYDVSQ